MSVMYRTKQGDVLDSIVFRHYQGQVGALEKVFEANRKLASHGPVLPAGILITLPDIPKPKAKESITLW